MIRCDRLCAEHDGRYAATRSAGVQRSAVVITPDQWLVVKAPRVDRIDVPSAENEV